MRRSESGILLAHATEAVRLLREATCIYEEITSFEESSKKEFPRKEIYEKALQKYFQDAYREIEFVLSLSLELFGESVPRSERWHSLLIEMATMGSGERPPLAPRLRQDFDELRRFRHVATHGYGGFHLSRAPPAIDAARAIMAEFVPALEAFLQEALDRDADLPPATP